jgi:hypothetical protein
LTKSEIETGGDDTDYDLKKQHKNIHADLFLEKCEL